MLMKAIGVVLAFVGVVLIGFFGVFNQPLGLYGFPFSENIKGFINLVSFGALGQTVAWWNAKLWGMAIALVGCLLMRFG